MKNKWLIGIASAMLTVTMAFGLAACGGLLDNNDGQGDTNNGGNTQTSDADIAKQAIGMLKDAYLNADANTPGDYKVWSRTKVGDVFYNITWTATTEDEGVNISDYITIGEPDSEYNITVHVEPAGKVVNYKLKASVTVGAATETFSFDRVIPKVYTVSGIEEFGADLAKGSYYEVDGVKVGVLVTGYVVSRGTYSADYKNYNDVYISDDPDTNTTEYPTAMQVYRLALDGTILKEDADLMVGAKVVVYGWLQNFYDKLQLTHDASSSTGKSGVNPSLVKITPPELSDQEKVDLAKEMLTLTKSVYAIAGEEVELPDSIVGATITWTASGTGATVTGNTLTIADPLPTSQQEVTLTAAISAGSASGTKTFTIKIGLSRSTPSTKDDPYTVAQTNEFCTTIATGAYSARIFVEGYVVKITKFSSNRWQDVYLADTAGETDTAKQLRVYTLSLNDVLTKESDLAVGDKVTLSGFIQNYNGTYELTNNTNETESSVYCVKTSNTSAGQPDEPVVDESGKVFKRMETPTEGEFVFAARKNNDILYVSDNTQLDSGDEGYLKTTTDVTKAVKLKLEKKSGSDTEWYIKLGEKYLEVNPYYNAKATSKVSYNLRLVQTTPNATWTWDNDIKIFKQVPVATEDLQGNTASTDYYYIGNRNGNSFDTLSPSSTSYITGNNAGNLDKTQHPGRFGTIENMTDEQKAQAVLDSLKLSKTSFSVAEETIDLPTSTAYDAEVTWSVKSGNEDEYVQVNANKLKVLKLATGEPVEITLQVSVKVGTETVTKDDIVITIETPAPDGTTEVTFDATKKYSENTELANVDIVVDENITIKFAGGGSYKAKYYVDKTAIRCYNSNTLTITLADGFYLSKIVFTYGGDDGTAAITVDKGTFVDDRTDTKTGTWTGGHTGTIVFTVGSSGGNRRIKTIAFEYHATTHVHSYTASQVQEGFVHKYTCSNTTDCYYPAYIVPCELTNNKCSVCNHEYTEQTIQNALFALGNGESLPGDTYELEGHVLRINNVYDSTYKNVTFTMKIGTHEVQAFRATGTEAANVQPGDTVRVKGGLTNYSGTYEFTAACVILSRTAGNLTPQEKVDEVKTWLGEKLPDAVENVITLPTVPAWASGVTFTWQSGNNAVAVNNNTTLTITPQDEAGTATITVTIKHDGVTDQTAEFTVAIPAKPAEGQVTVSKTMKAVATENSWSEKKDTQYLTYKLDNVVTITATKSSGDNTGKYYPADNKNEASWRLYSSEKATLTITVPAEYKLISIKITFSEGGFGDGITSGVAKSVSGSTITLTTSAKTFVTAIEVVYAPVASAAAAAASSTSLSAPVADLPHKD